jgi:hypothetical protein
MYDNLAMASVAVQASLAYIIDSSYFAGMANFLETTRRGREAGDIPRGVLRQVASMVTPFVGLQRSMIRSLDATGLVPGSAKGQITVRRPDGLFDTMTGSVFPLALTEIGPKPALTVFGQPQRMLSTPLGEIVPFVPPVQRGYAAPSPLEDTLAILEYFPGMPAQTDAATGRRLPNDTYRALVQRRGEIMQPQMEQLVESEGFQRLSREAQKKLLQRIAARATVAAKREMTFAAPQ